MKEHNESELDALHAKYAAREDEVQAVTAASLKPEDLTDEAMSGADDTLSQAREQWDDDEDTRFEKMMARAKELRAQHGIRPKQEHQGQ